MADEQHQPGGGADGPDARDRTRRFGADDDRTVMGGDRSAPTVPGGPGDPAATTAMPGVPGDPAATTAMPGDPWAGNAPPGVPDGVGATSAVPGDSWAPGPTPGRPGDPAATTAMPGVPGRPGDPAATTAMPAAGATAPLHQGPAAGATAPLTRPDGTAGVPPAAVWSGRAEVKPPAPPVVRTAGPVGWEATGWEAEERSGRSWWMPILLGLLALLLISLLGVGVWLITQSASRSDAPVVPTPSATPSRKAASTAATSAAPRTVTPPAATTARAAPDVVMPDLVGQSSQEARDVLDDLNLTYRLRSQPSDQPAGTVIDTDPPAGQQLPAGARVTLVIASPPRTTAAPRPTVTPISPTPTR